MYNTHAQSYEFAYNNHIQFFFLPQRRLTYFSHNIISDSLKHPPNQCMQLESHIHQSSTLQILSILKFHFPESFNYFLPCLHLLYPLVPLEFTYFIVKLPDELLCTSAFKWNHLHLSSNILSYLALPDSTIFFLFHPVEKSYEHHVTETSTFRACLFRCKCWN